MNYIKNLIFHKLSLSNDEFKELSSNSNIVINNCNKSISSDKIKENNKNNDVTSIQFVNRDNTINLLTYNLFLRPIVSTNGNDYKNQRVEDFLDELERFDIICFQEVFGLFNTRKTNLIYEAAKRGYYYYAEPPSPNILSVECMDGGILIISRFHIEKIDFLPYTYGSHIDAIVVKGLVYVKVRIKDTYFHLFNTHLQATYNTYTKEERVYFATRKSQIEELALNISELLKRHYFNKTEKILLCGDLNIDASYNSDYSWLYGKHKSEYSYLMDQINMHDYTSTNIYHYYKKEHPITYGGDDKILYHPECYNYKQSLDYIIEIKYKGDIDKNIKTINNTKSFIQKPIVIKDTRINSNINIIYDSIKVESFYLNEEAKITKNRPYNQLSDHYGLSISLNYSNDNDNNNNIDT